MFIYGGKLMDILHVDMNSFYVSCELIDRPDLKNQAVAVGGDEKLRHGIILAKTPKAKQFGVLTGEPIWQAKKKCPNLTILPPNYEKYIRISKAAQKIYYSYTNQVEPYGMDECFLDVTGSFKLFGKAEEIGYQIKERIKRELKLTVSVGVSFNKVFAKLASDMRKPDYLTSINKDNFKKIVYPLKVSDMIMIGQKTTDKLNKINIKTLGDLANSDPEILRKLLGINGLRIYNWANGWDNSKVRDYYETIPIKSLGRSITCKSDLLTFEELRAVVQKLSEDLSKRLIENNYLARGISIGYRKNSLVYESYDTLLAYPSNSTLEISAKAMEVVKNKFSFVNGEKIRAVYIRAIKLVENRDSVQVDMFNDIEKHFKYINLEKAVYKIREKYGRDSVSYGNLLGDLKMPSDGRELVTMLSSFLA